jgi:uncharacterized protein YkwD
LRRAISNPSAIALVTVLALAGLFVFYEFQPISLVSSNSSATSSTPSTTSAATVSGPTTSPSTSTVSSSFTSSPSSVGVPPPLIGNGSFTLSYPSDYTTLANYLLGRINQDRANFSLSPVILSPIESAQQHADSMLYFGYFSHWDTQGYKPYMRYTLLNGVGSVEENIAFESTTLPSFTTDASVESTLSGLEYSMMYNDSMCCQNGHRDNILDPLHNRVSIGVAYNSTHLYMVEDFENYYINFTAPFLEQDNTVSLIGNSSLSLDDMQIVVYYDPLPQPLTISQLGNVPYSGSYDTGTFIGGVVSPCLLSCETYDNGITVNAQTWNVSSNEIDVVFQLADFIQQHGDGVYTVYIEQGPQPEIIFDTSFFLSS